MPSRRCATVVHNVVCSHPLEGHSDFTGACYRCSCGDYTDPVDTQDANLKFRILKSTSDVTAVFMMSADIPQLYERSYPHEDGILAFDSYEAANDVMDFFYLLYPGDTFYITAFK